MMSCRFVGRSSSHHANQWLPEQERDRAQHRDRRQMKTHQKGQKKAKTTFTHMRKQWAHKDGFEQGNVKGWVDPESAGQLEMNGHAGDNFLNNKGTNILW